MDSPQTEKKSNVQMIIGAIMHHGPVNAKEIAEIVTEMAGREIKVQDVASMLSRLSDEGKCDLGYFIRKEKEGKSYRYSFADELRPLGEDKAYGLTVRTGRYQVDLEDLLEERPELKPYVENPRQKPRRSRQKGNRTRLGRPPLPKPKASTKPKSGRGPGRPRKNPVEPTPISAVLDGKDAAQLAGLLENLRNINVHLTVTVRLEGFGE
jgi:hypothetical protein